MAYRSSTQIATTSGLSTSLTVNKPSGVVENDIIHLFWVNGGGNTSTITFPAGFTQYSANASTATPDTKTIRCAWKRAGSSEPATYQVSTDIGGGDKCILICVAHSGRHTTTAPTATATTQTTAQADPVSIAATGFTATDGDDVIWFGAQSGDGGEAVFIWTYTAPTNYTERQEAAADAYTSGAVATRDNIAAGATGTITGTMTSVDATQAGYGAFVIRLPAADAGGSTVTKTPTTGHLSLGGLSVLTDAFTAVRIRDVLINESGQPVGSQTNIRLMVWYGGQCRGAPDVSLNGQTTDTNGTASWSIPTGSLVNGSSIFYVAQDSLSFSNYTCARMIPSYEAS